MKHINLKFKLVLVLSTILLLCSAHAWGTVPADTYYSFTTTKSANAVIDPISGVSTNKITVGSSGSVISSSATFANTSYSYALQLGNSAAKGCTIDVSATAENPAHIILFCSASGARDIYLYSSDGTTMLDTAYCYGAPSVVDLKTSATGALKLYANNSTNCYYVQVLYEGNSNIFTRANSGNTISLPSNIKSSSDTLCFFKPCEVPISDGKFVFGGSNSALRKTISFKSHVTGTLTINATNSSSSDGRIFSVKQLVNYKTLSSTAAGTSSSMKKKTSTSLEVNVTQGKRYAIYASGADVTITSITVAASGNTLQYNANGGTGEMANTTGSGSVTLSKNTYTKSGCSFQGWATTQANANAGTVAYADEASYTLSADATLYAVWKLNTPTISCTNNVVTITVPGSSTVYYTTDGSTTPTSSSTAYDPSNKPTIVATTTFKAIAILANHVSSAVATQECVYTTPTYTITNGSPSNGIIAITDGSSAITSAEEDDKVYITASPNPGYSFSSWDVYKTSASGTKVTPAASLASTYFTMPDYAVTVNASFSAINYDVTYSAPTNGDYTISVAGGSATSASKTATIGQTITLAATPSSGYVLSSWTVSKESGGTVTVSNNQFTMPADNVTITATFARVYTVTYSAGASATCKASDTQASSGENITLATPTWSSHTFLGWYVGDTKIGNAGATYAPTADITVYGAWKEDCAGGSAEVWFSSSNKNDADEYFASMSTSSNTTQLVGGSVAKLIAVGSSDLQADPGNKKVGYRLDSRLNIVFKFDATTSLDIYLTNGGSSGRTCQLASFSSDKALSNIGTSDYSSKTTVTSNVSATGAEVSTVAAGSATVSSGVITITGSGGLKISYTSLAAGYYVFYSTSSSSMYVSGFEESAGSGTCYYVTYDGNGADGGLTCDPTAYAANEDPEVLDNGDGGSAYTKDGYTFTGWNTLANGTGTPYAAGGTITDISDNVTLHAQWTSGTTFTLTASATVINPITEDDMTGAITATITNSPVTGIISGTTTSTSSNEFTVAKASSVTVTAPLTVDGSTEECDDCTYRFDSWENIPASVTEDVSNIHAKYNTTYSLSYTLDGGDWADAYSAPTYYVYGTGATLPVAANVEKEGYAFAGWTNDDGGAFITEAGAAAWGNIAVTANWTPAGYDITYNCDGADSGCPSNQTNKTKLPNPLPAAPVKDGYAFVGWYTNSTKTEAAVAGATLEDDVTLYAKWAALHSVTVTYGSGGSAASAESASVGEGLTTTISATPATGYNFSAWEFTSNTGSATLDNTASNPATLTMGTANVTVNATFSAKTYVVTLDANGGTGGSANVTMTYNLSTHTSITNPTKASYSLDGWYTGSGGTGTKVMAADGTLQANVGGYTGAGGIWIKDATTTLYAKWSFDCPEDNSGNTIYKFVPVTSSSDNIADATEFTTDNYLSELTGGTLTSHCTASGNVKMNSNGVQLASSTGYLELNFECALQTGDKVKWKCYSAGVRLCNSTTYDISKDLVLAKSQDSYSELYITSAMEGKTKLYIMHSGSNATVMTFELYRAGGYSVTYKANGSGESDVVHTTATVEDNMFTRNGYTFTGWNTENDGSGDPYSVGAEVTEELTLYAQWECTTPTFSTDLSTTPHEVIEGDDAVTLTVAASANSGTVTYQWYSNTSKSTAGATTLTTGASYNAPTSSIGTLYYYCIATNSTAGCSTTVQSNYATVVVSEAPCFRITDAGKNGSWSKSKGETISNSEIDGSITGGTVTYSGKGTLTANDTHGFIFDDDNDEVTISLSGSHVLAAGSVITIVQHGNSSTSKETGFKISGNSMSPATCNNGSTTYKEMTQTYTVVAADGVAGHSSFTIKWTGTNQVYLKSMTVTGCEECDAITPSLSYDKTTLWVNDGDIATPTLDKDESTGSVTYSSSNTDIATVNESTGVVTAVAGGNVTITASIAADGTHCANTATCNLTIKNATCAEVVIAGVTLSAKNAGTPEGTLIASSSGYVVSTQKWEAPDGGCGTGGKLGAEGNYVCLTLKSGESFQNGDKVILDIAKVSDVGDNKLHIYAGTSSAGTQLGENASPVCGENEIILSGISSSTPSITLYRTSGDDQQNPYVVSMKVKRFICTDCLGFFDGTDNGSWNTAGNWIGSTGVSASVPTASDRVHIYKPVTVSGATAALASEVILYTNTPTNTGKLTIASDGVLKVAGTIQAYNDATSTKATAVSDVIIDCGETSQGALIFENPSGDKQAQGTVNFYTKSSRVCGKLQWQYVGYPFISGYDYDYGGYYINKYSETQGGWIVMRDQGDRSIAAWDGLAISGDDEGGASMTGTFVPTTGDKALTLTYTAGNGKGKNLIGNSWTAPIQILEMEEEDFGGARATVYVFNTGRYGSKEVSPSGSWVTLAIDAVKDGVAAGTWTNLTVIPAFQGFQVKTAATEDKTLTLNYDKHVRPATDADAMNEPLRAPARRANSEINHMRLTVESDVAHQDVFLFEGPEFSEDFDNGWDGDYVGVSGQHAYLYVVSPTLGKMAIDAESSLEGRIVALQSAAEKEYTFTFAGNGMGYYLNDLKTQTSTLIEADNSYTFTYEQGDDYNRFMISATPFAKTTPTGIEDGSLQKVDGVQKVLYKDHMYIIRGGRVFDATGGLVK